MVQPDSFLDWMLENMDDSKLNEDQLESIALDLYVKHKLMRWMRITLFDLGKIPKEDCLGEQVIAYRDEALVVLAILAHYGKAVRLVGVRATCRSVHQLQRGNYYLKMWGVLALQLPPLVYHHGGSRGIWDAMAEWVEAMVKMICMGNTNHKHNQIEQLLREANIKQVGQKKFANARQIESVIPFARGMPPLQEWDAVRDERLAFVRDKHKRLYPWWNGFEETKFAADTLGVLVWGRDIRQICEGRKEKMSQLR